MKIPTTQRNIKEKKQHKIHTEPEKTMYSKRMLRKIRMKK